MWTWQSAAGSGTQAIARSMRPAARASTIWSRPWRQQMSKRPPKDRSENPSYEVGYGRPPRETQFVKGRSGNKNGRPKGSKNLGTILNEAGRQLVEVTENG